MPIQIQDIDHESEHSECPLCMEPLEVDDINFFPCTCGYQICRFCWHRIRTDENGLCPACRTSYPEDPAEFKPLTGSDLQKIRHEKRQKEVQRRQKLTDGRRHLASIRVLQKNLVFVVGLSHRLSDPEILKRQEYFGKYGKIVKVVINSNTAYAGTQGPSSSAYVTYSKMEEALQAIQSVNNVYIDGRTLKASLGTTKYCSTYLKNQQCHKGDCMYLHELAEDEASFTKEDMQLGKHQEFEQRLIDRMVQRESEEQHHSSSENESISSTTANLTTVTTESTNSRKNTSTPHNTWSEVAKEKIGPENINEKPKERISPPPILTSKKPLPTQTLRETAGLLQKNVIRTDAKTALVTTPPPDISVTTPVAVSNADDISSNSDINGTYKDEDVQTPSINPTLNQCQNEETKDPPITISTNEFINLKLEENREFEKQLSNETQNLSLTTEVQPNSLNFPNLSRFSEKENSFNTDLYQANHFTNVDNSLTWNNTQNNPLPDVIPIKSSNDWEAAFGFNSDPVTPSNPALTPNPSGEDDDLGFDPWLEVNKGLTELLEKESNAQHNNTWPSQHEVQQTNNYSPNKNYFHHRNRFGVRISNMADYPPSHAPSQQNYPANPHHPHTHNTVTSPTRGGLSEWQNGLRALLPSVNINFAMDQPKTQNQVFNNNFHGNGGREKPRFQMGYDQWGFTPTNTNQPGNQSSLFPTSNHQNSLFQNNFGRSADRYGSVAPPPGLLSQQQFPNDPAIVAGGSKPLPTSYRAPQHHLEDTPHWMKSLQTLTDTDSYNKPGQSAFLPPKKDGSIPANTSFPGWPNIVSRDQINHQPPPGFQSRLPYTNSTEFGLMLENHS